MSGHAHTWTAAGFCDAPRAGRECCHARRCVRPDCRRARVYPSAFCYPHGGRPVPAVAVPVASPHSQAPTRPGRSLAQLERRLDKALARWTLP